ncbi:MAG: hypothetical protein ABIN67_01325 [Ferruginibacter sp.]
MKKLLVLAIVAASFASCADSEKKVEETSTKDTMTVVTPVAPDTTMIVKDSTVKTTVTTDTTKK